MLRAAERGPQRGVCCQLPSSLNPGSQWFTLCCPGHVSRLVSWGELWGQGLCRLQHAVTRALLSTCLGWAGAGSSKDMAASGCPRTWLSILAVWSCLPRSLGNIAIGVPEGLPCVPWDTQAPRGTAQGTQQPAGRGQWRQCTWAEVPGRDLLSTCHPGLSGGGALSPPTLLPGIGAAALNHLSSLKGRTTKLCLNRDPSQGLLS